MLLFPMNSYYTGASFLTRYLSICFNLRKVFSLGFNQTPKKLAKSEDATVRKIAVTTYCSYAFLVDEITLCRLVKCSHYIELTLMVLFGWILICPPQPLVVNSI